MTPDPFTSLHAIHEFLQHEILPTVPTQLKSELRAALKNLNSVTGELEGFHPRLEKEADELLGLCRKLALAGADLEINHSEIEGTLLRLSAVLSAGSASTVELIQYREDLKHTLSVLISAAQAHAASTASGGTEINMVLGECFEILKRQAVTGSRWQTVFDPLMDDD